MDEIDASEGGISGGGGAAAPLPSRSAPRLSYEAVVRLSCAGRRGIHTGFVRDIAKGGMFLRLVDPEPVGRRLGFELFLPGWRTPARGVGEVAWNRPSYEGPGRSPGMAIRFVALEPRAIEMLAAVLPGGEAPVVEVLEPPRLPPVRRDEKPEPVAAFGDGSSSLAEPAAVELSLERLLAESRLNAPAVAASEPIPAELDEDGGPMIFVPPPPLPVLLPPPGPEVRTFAETSRGSQARSISKLRLGSAAAGIAAIGGLATMLVVGAARRDVLPVQRSAPNAAVEKPAAHDTSTVALVPARVGDASTTNVVEPLPAAPAAGPAAEPAPVALPSQLLPAPANVATVVADVTPPAAITTQATRLTGLRWEPLPAGGTRVTIALDGSFALSRLRASRIGGDSPRLVVRLLGLGAGAPRAPWEPSTPDVRRIRAGRHDGDGAPEIHLVLDLADSTVRLVKSEAVGAELRLDLAAVPADAR